MNKLEYTKEDIIEMQNDIDNLQQENKQLKEQLDKYENPNDMTLMMMWATDKVKDENKQLQEKIESLESQLDFIEEQNKYINKLEQRIDKAIEYIEKSMNNPLKYEWGVIKHTLEILKGDM